MEDKFDLIVTHQLSRQSPPGLRCAASPHRVSGGERKVPDTEERLACPNDKQAVQKGLNISQDRLSEMTHLCVFLVWLGCSPLCCISLASRGSRLMAMWSWLSCSSRLYITRAGKAKVLRCKNSELFTQVRGWQVCYWCHTPLTRLFPAPNPPQNHPGNHARHSGRLCPVVSTKMIGIMLLITYNNITYITYITLLIILITL